MYMTLILVKINQVYPIILYDKPNVDLMSLEGGGQGRAVSCDLQSSMSTAKVSCRTNNVVVRAARVTFVDRVTCLDIILSYSCFVKKYNYMAITRR